MSGAVTRTIRPGPSLKRTGNLFDIQPTYPASWSVPISAAPGVSATDLVTKQQVDGLFEGLDVKASVKAASTANLVLSGEQTVDGVALVAGDRLLVKDQTLPAQNGLYVVAVGAWARSSDANTSAKVTSGLFTWVERGAGVQADSGWVLTTEDPIVLGTTALSFTQFSGAGQITAGNGLSKSGNTLSIDTAVTVDKTTAQTLTNKTLTSPVFNGNITPNGSVDGNWNPTPTNARDLGQSGSSWRTLFGRTIKGDEADGATAVGVILDTVNAFVTSGAKLLSVRNVTVEKLYIDKDGGIGLSGRKQEKQGADVASANNLTLGTGNYFAVTGTTQINLLDSTTWQDGSDVELHFTGSLTVKTAQPASGAFLTILLSAGLDLSTAVSNVLRLRLGTVGGTRAWRQIGTAIFVS